MKYGKQSVIVMLSQSGQGGLHRLSVEHRCWGHRKSEVLRDHPGGSDLAGTGSSLEVKRGCSRRQEGTGGKKQQPGETCWHWPGLGSILGQHTGGAGAGRRVQGLTGFFLGSITGCSG